jgi:hypothetical protein
VFLVVDCHPSIIIIINRRVAFTHRVLHVNFSIALDGTTALPQLLQFWDAEWNIAKLLR